MQTLTERTEENDLPIAELIARRLDEECTICGQTARCSQLPFNMITDIAGRIFIKKELALEPIETFGLIESFAHFTEKCPDGAAEVVAAAGVFATPERHDGRRSLCRRHNHTICLDVLHAPSIGAEQKHIADAPLVDKLLIQFANPCSVAGVGGILSSVRDSAAAHQRHLPTARQR